MSPPPSGAGSSMRTGPSESARGCDAPTPPQSPPREGQGADHPGSRLGGDRASGVPQRSPLPPCSGMGVRLHWRLERPPPASTGEWGSICLLGTSCAIRDASPVRIGERAKQIVRSWSPGDCPTDPLPNATAWASKPSGKSPQLAQVAQVAQVGQWARVLSQHIRDVFCRKAPPWSQHSTDAACSP